MELEILPQLVELKHLRVLIRSVGTRECRVGPEDQCGGSRTLVVERSIGFRLSSGLVHLRSNSLQWSPALGRDLWLRLPKHLFQMPAGPREVFRA